jgi:5'-nucleotidase (lipoprotein e(P4) family)
MKRLILFFGVTLSFIAADAQDTLTVSGMSNVKLLPVLWQQHSAEYEALCYQAFNIATCRLNEMKLRKRKRYAIITDVDETVLDNSYYEAKQILLKKEFDLSTWKQWTSMSSATALPGAAEFFQLAKRKGVEIFYISNRDTSEVSATVKNLRHAGFPDADREHMLFLENVSSKEERRQRVIREYQVVMLLGDNLNDFSSVFEKTESTDRSRETANLRNEWGRKFIVLPNVTYGEWENALYNYSRKLSPSEKEIILKSKLITPSQE